MAHQVYDFDDMYDDDSGRLAGLLRDQRISEVATAMGMSAQADRLGFYGHGRALLDLALEISSAPLNLTYATEIQTATEAMFEANRQYVAARRGASIYQSDFDLVV